MERLKIPNRVETPLLICGDSTKAMDDVPDASVDLLLTDMPYGTTACRWDSVIDLDRFWKQAWRVLKADGVAALWAQAPFDKALAMSDISNFRYEWIIEKNHATGFLNANRMPMKAHENVLVFYRSLPYYAPQMTHGHERKVATAEQKARCVHPKWEGYGNHGITGYDSTDRYPRDVLRFTWDRGNSWPAGAVHPTRKPVAALTYFIRTYTRPGGVVLDPFMGGGSAGVACALEGRRFIGLEKDPSYFDAAKSAIMKACHKDPSSCVKTETSGSHKDEAAAAGQDEGFLQLTFSLDAYGL